MRTILFCTKSKTLLEHWRESLINTYANFIQIDSEKGLLKCLDNNVDVTLLLDSNFFINSKDYIRSILDSYSSVKILYMDDCPSFKVGKELLPFGIKGYANSRLSSIHLTQAIDVINDNSVWLYPEFIQQLIKDVSFAKESKEKKELAILTSKEKEISKLVAKGYSNKIIAIKCNVTEATIKVHLRSIFRKLNLTDRLSLALIFN
ncbi:response regulator transcription factor [Sulfurospirillum arcachonense]|uniref:response regulator transcription factor n=1 Tax=Sulfurospirillum arcachonense TaxID=57666 RepID=UPI0004691C5B|nr:response regulator transcription factor [Sulfurospirillum arcachonense]